MNRKILIGGIAVFGLVGSAVLANYLFVHRYLSEVISSDSRNNGVSVVARFGYLVVPSCLVFDLREVSSEKSPADVTRVLLQFAAKLKDSRFDEVLLSYRGVPKFVVKGDYFKKLGNEFGAQNPVYTMRTIPENLYLPDQSRAYKSWTGGLIGVTGKQLEDFSDFHKRWYLVEMSKTK